MDVNKGKNKGGKGFGGNGNLISGHQWVPGKSGNPDGRPKGAKTGVRARLKAILRKNATPEALQMAKDAGIDLEDGTIADLIAARLALEAANGDTTAINTVFKQTEVPIELEGEDDSEGKRSRVLSPNAREIAAALDRE